MGVPTTAMLTNVLLKRAHLFGWQRGGNYQPRASIRNRFSVNFA